MEWIIQQAVKKLTFYSDKMSEDECIQSRGILIKLIIAIIKF